MQPGEIQFSDNASPALPAGDYRIVVQQKVKLPDEFESPEPYRAEQRMRVTGPHFGLGGEDVVAVYPPAQADGDFSAALCHVILRDPSLPWRIALRPAAAAQETDAGPTESDTAEADPLVAPWLAILLLTPDEYVPPDSDELTGSQAVPLAAYLSPPAEVLGPDFTAEQRQQWLAEFPQLHCTVIDVTSEAFAAVAPLAADLPYLAHVRDVPAGQPPPIAVEENPPDQEFAVVIGSRLPGGSPSGEYAAHLVSLEGFADYLGDGDGVPAGYAAVRLLSLARWAFTSTTPAAYLTDLLRDLKIGVLRLEPPDGPLQRPIELGYVPADYRTRLGERTAAWYRGPCLPVQMKRNMQPIYPSAEAALVYDAGSGMFDVSFATAWQTGRLLALADRAFSSALLAWIRDHHRLSQLLLERIALFQNYRQLGPGDLLTTGLTGRLLRRLVTEKVAARLAGPDPPLGPPGDPSGLLRHLHRLPGLLSPAEVDDVLRAGEDPHTAVTDRIRGAG
jgi:hypothetical protein